MEALPCPVLRIARRQRGIRRGKREKDEGRGKGLTGADRVQEEGEGERERVRLIKCSIILKLHGGYFV